MVKSGSAIEEFPDTIDFDVAAKPPGTAVGFAVSAVLAA